jgi:metal-sulfur cluster biosynthetic enzyme
MVTTNEVLDSLRPITDPEIGLDIVELGLIYGVDVSEDGKKVEIAMTLTSPMCPYGPEMVAAANAALGGIPGVEEAKVNLVWVPRWDPRVHASEDAKAYLGIW